MPKAPGTKHDHQNHSQKLLTSQPNEEEKTLCNLCAQAQKLQTLGAALPLESPRTCRGAGWARKGFGSVGLCLTVLEWGLDLKSCEGLFWVPVRIAFGSAATLLVLSLLLVQR